MSHAFDRYVSFIGSDWQQKSDDIITALQFHIQARNSPFWPYFLRQRDIAHAQGLDDLRVLHNFLPTLKELLEDLGDRATLLKLEDLEETCM